MVEIQILQLKCRKKDRLTSVSVFEDGTGQLCHAQEIAFLIPILGYKAPSYQYPGVTWISHSRRSPGGCTRSPTPGKTALLKKKISLFLIVFIM